MLSARGTEDQIRANRGDSQQGDQMPRTQQKRQDRSHKNYQSEMPELFSEGMGADPTSDHEVGHRKPKLGVVAKNSQKFFNR